MSAKPRSTKKVSNQHQAIPEVGEAAQKDGNILPDQTGGQNGTIDQKRNDEQQYHAAGVAHDPHNRTKELIDSGDPAAGDLNEETLSESAPFNKTYGRHK